MPKGNRELRPGLPLHQPKWLFFGEKMKICATCRWGSRIEASAEHPFTFECRRVCPGIGGHPNVLAHHWCGNHELPKQAQAIKQEGYFECSDELDLAGLRTQEFRVFVHLMIAEDRGFESKSVAEIAETCRINRKTVFEALNELIRRRMIHKTVAPGFPSKFSVLHSEWWDK
jgi:hypothetical protein